MTVSRDMRAPAGVSSPAREMCEGRTVALAPGRFAGLTLAPGFRMEERSRS